MVIAVIFSFYSMFDSVLLMILGTGLMIVALHAAESNNLRYLLIYFKTKGDKV